MRTRLDKFHFKNSRGSALGLIVTAMGLLGVATVATINISDHLNKGATADTQTRAVDNFAQLVENLVTSPVACYGTVSGQPRTNPTATAVVTDLGGLRFYPSGGGPATRMAFEPVPPTPPGTQDVVIGGFILNSANNRDIAKNMSFPNLDIRVDNLYLQNIQADPILPNTFQANLMLSVGIISNPNKGFAPRSISRVTLKFNGTNQLIGCVGTIPAQSMCEQMGCRYNPASANQKCFCGFPDMDCNSGIPADGERRYISGWDPATNAPICKSIEISCASKGPGYFFAGMDSYGSPICLAVESNTTPPPTTTTTIPSSCPTGASPTGLGVAINGSCRCNSANDIWDGTTCEPYSPDCQYVFSGGSFLPQLCAEGDPPAAMGSGYCTAALGRYVDNSRPAKICNGHTVIACGSCGPGSNLPAGICTADPSCATSPPTTTTTLPPSGFYWKMTGFFPVASPGSTTCAFSDIRTASCSPAGSTCQIITAPGAYTATGPSFCNYCIGGSMGTTRTFTCSTCETSGAFVNICDPSGPTGSFSTSACCSGSVSCSSGGTMGSCN